MRDDTHSSTSTSIYLYGYEAITSNWIAVDLHHAAHGAARHDQRLLTLQGSPSTADSGRTW